MSERNWKDQPPASAWAQVPPRLPPPLRAPPLEYATPGPRPPAPTSLQASAGFATWCAGLALYSWIAQQTTWTDDNQTAVILSILLGIILFTVLMHLALGWRSFAGGVLLGASLTCLLPLGIFWALCGTHH